MSEYIAGIITAYESRRKTFKHWNQHNFTLLWNNYWFLQSIQFLLLYIFKYSPHDSPLPKFIVPFLWFRMFNSAHTTCLKSKYFWHSWSDIYILPIRITKFVVIEWTSTSINLQNIIIPMSSSFYANSMKYFQSVLLDEYFDWIKLFFFFSI